MWASIIGAISCAWRSHSLAYRWSQGGSATAPHGLGGRRESSMNLSDRTGTMPGLVLQDAGADLHDLVPGVAALHAHPRSDPQREVVGVEVNARRGNSRSLRPHAAAAMPAQNSPIPQVISRRRCAFPSSVSCRMVVSMVEPSSRVCDGCDLGGVGFGEPLVGHRHVDGQQHHRDGKQHVGHRPPGSTGDGNLHKTPHFKTESRARTYLRADPLLPERPAGSTPS